MSKLSETFSRILFSCAQEQVLVPQTQGSKIQVDFALAFASLSVSGKVQLYQTKCVHKCVMHCVWSLPRGCESGDLVRARDASHRSGYPLLPP